MKDNLKILLSLLTISLTFSACTNLQTNLKKFNYSKLHTAVRLNQINSVKLLVKNNIDINKIDNFGDSPLVDAIRNNYTDIAILLICNNANTRLRDKNNYTLLDMAIRNNNNEMVRILNDSNTSKYCIKKEALVKESNAINNNIIFINDSNKYNDVSMLNNSNIDQHEKNTSNTIKELSTSNNENIKENSNLKIEGEELTQSELNSYITSTEVTEVNLDKRFNTSKKENIDINKNLINELSEIEQSNVLFDKNNLSFLFYSNNKLNKEFKNILNDFIPSFMYIISNYKEKVHEIRIKNYTSSEYRTKDTISAKFIANSILSQRRANKISNYIIDISNKESFDTNWLSSKLVTQGMSSQGLIYDIEGNENKEKSRRTEIKIILK